MSPNGNPLSLMSTTAEPVSVAKLSNKLLELLQAVRSNNVFADSFDQAVIADKKTLLQLAAMHTIFTDRFTSIISDAMPDASQADIDELVRQISVKSTAFCSAVALGEISDIESLAITAVCIALIQWVDHGMDRGDSAMREAVRLVMIDVPVNYIVDPIVRARYRGMLQIGKLLREIAHDPDDLSFLTSAAYEHTLYREMLVGELSKQYLAAGSKTLFWADNAEQIAWLSITNVALIFVAGMLYAIYRQQDSTLPDIQTIMLDLDVRSAVQDSANAAIRGWDDLGDRRIDASAEGAWGKFVINLFNQQAPGFLNAFLLKAGVPKHELSAAVDLLTHYHDSEYQVVAFFVDLVASRFASIPASSAAKYSVFLTLAKRVVEAGYVNRLSDIFVADNIA
jgi:hypothetical protein